MGDKPFITAGKIGKAKINDNHTGGSPLLDAHDINELEAIRNVRGPVNEKASTRSFLVRFLGNGLFQIAVAVVAAVIVMWLGLSN